MILNKNRQIVLRNQNQFCYEIKKVRSNKAKPQRLNISLFDQCQQNKMEQKMSRSQMHTT